MYTERMAIQDELHENRRQMQDLRDRNMDLLKRLREIDERDMKDEVSYDGLNSLTQSLTEILDKMSEIIPHISPAQIIEHVTKNIDTSQVEGVKEDPKPEPTPVEKAAQQNKIHSKDVSPPLSKERAASVIKDILMESGEIKLNKVEEEFYKRTGKKYANFNNKMSYAMEKYPSIEKVGFGKYKIKQENKETDQQPSNMLKTSFIREKELQTNVQ